MRKIGDILWDSFAIVFIMIFGLLLWLLIPEDELYDYDGGIGYDSDGEG